jgi:type I restriction enzyme S subunit
MRASKTKHNEANLKKGQYFQYIVSKLEKEKPLTDEDFKTNLNKLNLIRGEKNKDVKKTKSISILKSKEFPFEIPENWFWLTIKDVIKLTDNLNIQSKLKSKQLVNYVDISCIDNNKFKIKEVKKSPVSELSSRARRVLKKDFFLYSLVRPYLNNMAIVEDEKNIMIASTGFAVFDSFYIQNNFFKLWMLSPVVQNYYNEMISGFNSPSITMNQFLDTPIPVAPIQEQNLIIDFFLALETDKQIENNALPKELIRGIIELDKLQNYSVSLFKNISNRKLLIPQLKQSILQEAIQGKLTAYWRKQNPTTEPASELLKRIKTEKAQLIKDKKIKKEKPLPPITKEEIPFELPEGWVWCRLGEINNVFLGGAAFSSSRFIKQSNIQVLRISNIKNDQLNISKNPVFIDDINANENHRNELFSRDILITMTGTREKRDYCFTVELTENHFKNKQLFLNQRVGCFRLSKKVNTTFTTLALKSQSLLEPVFDSSTGSANQANIGKDSLLNIIYPLPPLYEQKEIVKKVEALMKHCKELGQEIQTSEANAQMLMQAVLKEAFEGEAKKEMV